jgi:hypothetical protein
MLGLFKGLVEIVKLPIDVAADVVNPGRLIDDKKSYTCQRCERIMKKLNED